MPDAANPVLDPDAIDVVKVGLRLQARLVAFEIAMARPEYVIPRSLAEFIEAAAGDAAARS